MNPINLRQLLTILPDAQVTGPDDVEIVDTVYDSRSVGPGFLFVAVPTVGGDARSGGYRHIPQAIDSGAVAVIAQEWCAIPDDVPLVVVPDTRSALADIAAELFDHPSRRLHIFAVTGTDGKTTTAYFLDGLLEAAGYTTGLIGTVETKIGGDRRFNADRMTTPESLDLQRLLRAMVDAGVTHVSLEASSHALALHRLRGTELAAAAVTNITGDHLEFHGSFDAYFDAKASLFADVARGRPAILNQDDESYRRLFARIAGPIRTYGTTPVADVWASNLWPHHVTTGCVFHADGYDAETLIPLPGTFNVSNALAATGLALAAGLQLSDIAAALPHVMLPPGRMQRVEAGQAFHVLVDYAHTANAFRSVLSSLRQSSGSGRLIAVFGAAGGRDHSKRPEFARIAREHADYFIITNEDPCDEMPNAIMEEVASGIEGELEGTQYEREPDRGAAIARAISLARHGDTVIILGKGHEQSIVVNGHKEPWSDSTAALDALEALG